MEPERRLALVTGGSSGLGAAIAAELHRAGFRLVLAARTPEKLQQTAAAIGEGADSILWRSADVSMAAGAADLFEWIDRLDDPLELLVNSAGSARFSSVVETDPACWLRLVQSNLDSVFYCSREAARRMQTRGRGDIITILSMAADHVLPGAGAYCAAKAGALALTRVLMEEVRRQGVRVTAVLPGAIDTPLWDEIPNDLDRSAMLRPEEVAEVVRRIAELPRTIYVDEVKLMPPRGVL